MEEVFPGIFLIEQKGSFEQIKPSENIYILAGHDGIIYDAGYGDRKSIKYFLKKFEEIKEFYKKNSKPFEIKRILVSHSHPDHFSGLNRLRKALLYAAGATPLRAVRKRSITGNPGSCVERPQGPSVRHRDPYLLSVFPSFQ